MAAKMIHQTTKFSSLPNLPAISDIIYGPRAFRIMKGYGSVLVKIYSTLRLFSLMQGLVDFFFFGEIFVSNNSISYSCLLYI